MFGLFGVRAVRSKSAVRPVRSSGCSLKINCSDSSVFVQRTLFGVRCSSYSVSSNCSERMRGSVLFTVRTVQAVRLVRSSGRSSNFEIFAVCCSVGPV